MPKKKKPAAQVTVSLNVMNDGTVSMVFPYAVEEFNADAEQMTQLGVNLIRAAHVAMQQQVKPYLSPVTSHLATTKPS